MGERESPNRTIPLMADRPRRSAIVAGGIAAIAGAPLTELGTLAVALILILGAIVQRWSPHPGRWLMWLGAFLLTLFVGLFVMPQGLYAFEALRSPLGGIRDVIAIALALASVALIGWCDVALIDDAKRSRTAPTTVEATRPRPADLIVWVVALGLSAYFGWEIPLSVRAARHWGRPDLLLIPMVAGTAVVFLDAKLILHTIRGCRLQRSRSGSGVHGPDG